jgi:hypothetical protein
MGKKKHMLLAEDPPVIVGGGSSTYIWIRKPLALTPVADPQPDYEIEFDKTHYNCFDVAVDLVSYKTHDGNNGGNRHPVKNRKKHCTRFYDSLSDPD